jgi:hypothetical protein
LVDEVLGGNEGGEGVAHFLETVVGDHAFAEVVDARAKLEILLLFLVYYLLGLVGLGLLDEDWGRLLLLRLVGRRLLLILLIGGLLLLGTGAHKWRNCLFLYILLFYL